MQRAVFFPTAVLGIVIILSFAASRGGRERAWFYGGFVGRKNRVRLALMLALLWRELTGATVNGQSSDVSGRTVGG